MKLSCNIIQDLLPLYEEGLCSEESRIAIEEHLKECDACRTQFEHLKTISGPDLPDQLPLEEQAVKKSFRKIRRKWGLSIISLLLIIPLVFLSVNQYRGIGICFTNIDEILSAGKYAYALAEGDYETAAACMDYEGLYEEILDLLQMKPEDQLSQWISVTIGNETYMATEDFYEQYLKTSEDSLSIWSYLILDPIPDILIPQEIFLKVAALNPDALKEDSEGNYVMGYLTYILLETQWGNYYLNSNLDFASDDPALEYASVLRLVPEAIYLEAKPELNTQANEWYQYVQTTYTEVDDMTLSEFTEYVQAAYTKDLHSITNLGITFSSASYNDSYLIEDEWNITYKIMVTVDGHTYPLYLDFRIGNNGLHIPSMSHPSAFPGNDDMAEALFLHYPR